MLMINSFLIINLTAQSGGTIYYPGELKIKSDSPQSMEQYYKDVPNVASCKEGYVKDSELQKVLDLVNYIRSIHGLQPVSYNTADDLESAKTCLMMAANGTITHFPPPSYECFTDIGKVGAEKSNLHINMYATENPANLATCESGIIGWLIDSYSSNPEKVGHRRAIINPFLKHFSFGRCDGKPKVQSQWAYVTTMSFKFNNPAVQDLSSWDDDFVAYPYHGYPTELFQKDFFLSFSAFFDKSSWSKNNVDYSSAIIEMKEENGNPVIVHSKYSDNEGWGSVVNCLVWKADNLVDNVRYNVKISNVKSGSETRNYEYWFKLGEAGPPRLDTPVLLSPENNSKRTATTMLLKWKSVTDATTYQLQIADNASFNNPFFDGKDIPKTEYEVSNLLKGKTYYWRIRAFNSQQQSNFSEMWNFSTEAEEVKPDAPMLMMPADKDIGLSLVPVFSWSSIPGAQGYYFQIATNSSFATEHLIIDEDLSSPAYKVPSAKRLSSDTEYFWRVKAYGNFGSFTETEWSPTRSFTTQVSTIYEQSHNGFSIANHPNPFSETSQFVIVSPDNCKATIEFYNELGIMITTEILDLKVGRNIFSFNFNNLPQGAYFYILKSKETSIFNKMHIIK